MSSVCGMIEKLSKANPSLVVESEAPCEKKKKKEKRVCLSKMHIP